ncbi:hypothetical protein [Ruegeria sp. HU-ET01832]|uniref:hypothetical protein n=1 Tax=Ruegeria sp. HU-ET01832 TaxID=3135906 RepID=UPI00333F1245
MYLLGVYFSKYYDWCYAFSGRNRRWVGAGLLFSWFLVFCVMASFLPGWMSVLILLAMSPFQGLFMLAFHRVWEKQDQVESGRRNQLWKTKKLLGRFEKLARSKGR